MDLRPLTIIIGPNNSHKTYIAYSIYALWDNLGNTSSLSLQPRHRPPVRVGGARKATGPHNTYQAPACQVSKPSSFVPERTIDQPSRASRHSSVPQLRFRVGGAM